MIYIWIYFKLITSYYQSLEIASTSTPVKPFRRVMHNFHNFSPVLWHYRRHVFYRLTLYTVMQHYRLIKLWTVIAAKWSSTAIRRRKCSDISSRIIQCCIMLHNFASGGEKAWLGYTKKLSVCSYLSWVQFPASPTKFLHLFIYYRKI